MSIVDAIKPKFINLKDYAEYEAEEGSDNEENDDKIKKKLDKDEDDRESEDKIEENLKELIDENKIKEKK